MRKSELRKFFRFHNRKLLKFGIFLQQYISQGTKVYCEMKMNITTEFIQSVVELRQSRESNQRSRRLIATEPEFIIAYECVGSGKDLCDVNPNYEIPNTIISNTEFINQSIINNTIQPVVSINNETPSPSSAIKLNDTKTGPFDKTDPSIIQEKNIKNSPSPVILVVNSANKLNTKITMVILICFIIDLIYIL